MRAAKGVKQVSKYNKIKQMIIDCIAHLDSEGLLSPQTIISVRVADKVLMAYHIDVNKFSKNDIKVLDWGSDDPSFSLHRAIYNKRKDVNATIFTLSPHAQCIGKAGVAIPAVLDDIAQIVGPTTKVAKSASDKHILSALKGRNGCAIKDSGSICIGRTLDEAFTASLVLEKGAKVFIEASVLGEVKAINYLEAMLMHFIYKKKYSQADQSAKMADMAVEG